MAHLFKTEFPVPPRLTEEQAEGIRQRAAAIMEIEDARNSFRIPEQVVADELQSEHLN